MPVSRPKSRRSSNNTTCSRISGCVCCWLILGTVGVVVWHFLGRPSTVDGALDKIKDIDVNDLTNVLGNVTLDDWLKGFGADPYVGDNTTFAWATDGTGLTLEIQNACDDDWLEEFKIAVNDWNQAEALDLKTKRVEVDHKCEPVDGVMKVCNGNYGKTGWLGINEVQFASRRLGGPSFAINSVAKMNEYYLQNADYPKRQYTMCHEIGHGFGLRKN